MRKLRRGASGPPEAIGRAEDALGHDVSAMHDLHPAARLPPVLHLQAKPFHAVPKRNQFRTPYDRAFERLRSAPDVASWH